MYEKSPLQQHMFNNWNQEIQSSDVKHSMLSVSFQTVQRHANMPSNCIAEWKTNHLEPPNYNELNN